MLPNHVICLNISAGPLHGLRTAEGNKKRSCCFLAPSILQTHFNPLQAVYLNLTTNAIPPRLASNLQQSCLLFQHPRIAGMRHSTQPQYLFYFVKCISIARPLYRWAHYRCTQRVYSYDLCCAWRHGTGFQPAQTFYFLLLCHYL